MNYYTIKEAIKITGKSESTLRNLARKTKANKGKGVKFEQLKTGHQKILFSEDFLNSCFNNSNNSYSTNYEATALEILHEQLKAKDKQIESLNERLKEAHILTANLENKLSIALPPPPEQRQKKRFLFWRR